MAANINRHSRRRAVDHPAEGYVFMRNGIIFFSILSILYLNITLYGQDSAQSSINPLMAVGRIYLVDQTTRVGTAFVAGESNNIFMPAHVATGDTLYFKSFGSSFWFRIAIKYVLPDLDLAIYQRTGGNQPISLPLGDINRTLPGDKIIFIGWESDKKLNIDTATISSKGKTIEHKESIDFIDFNGYGIPGYSGGPVLNAEGQVIAMIVQGWDMKPLKSDTVIRILRAYSVDLLRILEQKLDVSIKSKHVLPEKEKLMLIDILNDSQ